MNLVFIVEDSFGREFFTRFFKKKSGEGIFAGRLETVIRCPPGPKLDRIIKIHEGEATRIIVMADADGQNVREKEEYILGFIKRRDHVCVVILDHEIEEWICHSRGIKFDGKPSDELKHRIKYKKRHLPNYADKIDCKKLQDHPSFMRLAALLAQGNC